jgi:hypothetical protein
MPGKTKIPRIVRELQVSSAAPIRRGVAKSSGLYLLALRSHATRSQLPKRKLLVTIDSDGKTDVKPRPIKITHT